MTDESRIEVTHADDRITARLTGYSLLTSDNIEEVAERLNDLVRDQEQPYLAVDLADVIFLSSMALTKFIGLNGAVRAAGGRLSLLNVRPTIREVFAVTKLDQLIDVQPGDPRGLSA